MSDHNRPCPFPTSHTHTVRVVTPAGQSTSETWRYDDDDPRVVWVLWRQGGVQAYDICGRGHGCVGDYSVIFVPREPTP